MTTAAIVAIIEAGLPLVGKIVELVQLFLKASKSALTVEQVDAEIAKILARRETETAEENAAAGIKD